MPVFTSGVILLLYKVPNGVSIASPPALVAPPGAVWHTAQSPTAASKRPRSRVAADQVPALGGAMGAISPCQGQAVAAMPSSAPKAANNEPNNHFERFSGDFGGSPAVPALSACNTRSGVIGSSRKRIPVASKIALAIAAALGTEADSPAPMGGSLWRGIISTSICGTSGKVRIG